MHRRLTFSGLPTVPELEALGIQPVMLVEAGVAIVAAVADDLDPGQVPGLVSVEALAANDKLQQGWQSFFSPNGGEQTLIVQGYEDLPGALLADQCTALGASAVHANPGLPEHVRVVTATGAVLEDILGLDGVAYLAPVPSGYAPGKDLHYCEGAHTSYGPTSFDFVSIGWDGQGLGCAELSYFFENSTLDLSVSAQQSAVRDALLEWTNHADLCFREVSQPDQARSLDFLWAQSVIHGDGHPFDGPGGVLAHAFYDSSVNPEPIAGDVHYDDFETFTVGGINIFDMYSISLHEIGHALGLGHTPDPGAVMYPFAGVHTGLSPTDIAGIQSIYSFHGEGWEAQPLDWQVTNVTDEIELSPVGSNVFHNSSDGRMWNFYWDAGAWHHDPLSWSVTNVAGDLAASADGTSVFYRGVDNRMWRFYWTAGAWHNEVLRIDVTNVAGDVAKSAFGSYVFYRGTDGRMWNFYWSGGSWQADPLRWDVDNVASDVALTPLGSNVYYRDAADSLWNFYWSSGAWNNGILLSGTSNVNGGVVTSPVGSNVFYQGTDGRMWNYYWSSGWNKAPLRWDVNNVTQDLSPSTAGDGVFYRGTDNRMWQFLWDGAWQNSPLSYCSPNNLAGPIAARDGQVFYRGTDNRMWNYFEGLCQRGVE